MLHLVRLTVQFSLFLEKIIFLFNFKEVDNVPSRPSAVFPWCLTPGSHWAGNFSWYKCKTGKFLHLFLISRAELPPACHIELPSRREAGTVRQSDRHILSLSLRDTPSHSVQSRGSNVYFYLHSHAGKDNLGSGSLTNVYVNVN